MHTHSSTAETLSWLQDQWKINFKKHVRTQNRKKNYLMYSIVQKNAKDCLVLSFAKDRRHGYFN